MENIVIVMDAGYYIENIREEDLEEIWEIVCENQWRNYDIEDLRYIISVSPQCCYKLVMDGVIVGSIFGTLMNETLCISFFCVRSDKRRLNTSMKLGLTILRFAEKNAYHVMTYANEKMIGVYKRFGFLQGEYLHKYLAKNKLKNKNPYLNNVKKLTSSMLETEGFFEDRFALVKNEWKVFSLYTNATCWNLKSEKGSGYLFYRQKGEETGTIGPIWGDNDEITRELLKYVLEQIGEGIVYATDNFEIFDSTYSVEYTGKKVQIMEYKKYTPKDNYKKLVGGHHFVL